MLPGLIAGLSESYGELADLYVTILAQQGKAIVPLLKEGFDPQGKREMVRRIQLVRLLAGAGENAWFLSILPESKQAVREAVLFALGCCQENLQLLLELCQTERGKCKDAARRALALMEAPEAYDLWKAILNKKPEAVQELKGLFSNTASELVAGELAQSLDIIGHNMEFQGAKNIGFEGAKLLRQRLEALVGKTAPAALDMWRTTAERKEDICSVFVYWFDLEDQTLTTLWELCFRVTLLGNPCPELEKLARELSRNDPQAFRWASILYDLRILGSRVFFDRYGPEFSGGSLDSQEQIFSALSSVCWDGRTKHYCLRYFGWALLLQREETIMIALDGLDSRWFALLADPHLPLTKDTDATLMGWIDPENVETREILGTYFHARTWETKDLPRFWEALHRCRWQDWDGLYPRFVIWKGKLYCEQAQYYYDTVPMSPKQKLKEWRELDAFAKVYPPSRMSWMPTKVQGIIQALEEDVKTGKEC